MWFFIFSIIFFILEKKKEINENLIHLNLRDLKSSFIAMLSNYSFEMDILNNAKKLVMSDLTDCGLLLKNCNSKGTSYLPFCFKCKKKLDNQ